jgi:plastocyanin
MSTHKQKRIIAWLIVLACVLCLVLWRSSKPRTEEKFVPARNVFLQATSSPEITAPTKNEIIYTKDGFDPAVTYAKQGDTLTFINKSGASLDLVSALFAGKTIQNGKSYEITLSAPAAISISAKKHADQMGIIVVK